MKIFENVSLTTVEIIKNNGYAVEVHDVETQDGYILELHRIPQSKSGQKPTRNHPVFIHHGILGSSADWVLGGTDISLPMKLADAGYDVWMANNRGNTYSRRHVSMTIKQKAFWNFSLNEIGKYDLPGSIDYILKNTSSSQLHYIGYSMGSCVFFIMGSERPEYQPKIRSQISLAPVAFMSNTKSSLRYFAPYAKVINIIVQRISKGMLLPSSKLQVFLANTVCRERITQKWICEKCFIFSVCGSDPIHFNSKLIPLIMGHFPAGTSSMIAAHFAQFILEGTFDQYDYGAAKNMLRYNSTQPPSYNLKSIQVPITLIHGENDILANTEDVMRLKAQLPKVMDAFAVNDSYFNHVDFLWSMRVNELVNDPVKGILEKTDDPEWRYSGPPSSVKDNEIDYSDRKPLPEGLTTSPKFVPGLEFFVENLDAIIENTMPRTVDAKDAAEFERERDMQRTLFHDVIERFKGVNEKYERMWAGFTNDVHEWTDDVKTGVVTGVSDARDAVETHGKQTVTLVTGKLSVAGKSVADGVVKVESVVVDGVAKVKSAVAGGVANAEQSVVGGMAKAENFVHYGLSKADQAVGKALQTISKTLRFIK